VQTDEGKVQKVADGIRDKLSPHILARVYRVFRTNTEDKEMLLLNYIRFCFKHGSGVAFLHSHPLVLPIVKAEQKIGNEVHRLCGLIRFSAVSAMPASTPSGTAPPPSAPSPNVPSASAPSSQEILYARIAPDHDVLEFLAPHFTDRFKSEPFIIHDTGRARALIAWHRQWHTEDFTEEDAALFGNTAGEEAYRTMWRKYFDAIAIKERTNPRCQRNFMPARYWENLTEMQIRK
jgi:probable DNA metabolism protein